MEITIKSRSRKLINSNFLVCHEESQEAYNFYLDGLKQFHTRKLPIDIKNIMLSFSNISVIKSNNPKFYRIISGWRYAELIFEENMKIHVSVINDELSPEQIKFISWIDVLENLLSSWKHKLVLAQGVDLLEKMPKNIYELINSELKNKTEKALIENLSDETREVIGQQIKNFKILNKNNDEEQNTDKPTELENKDSLLSQLINKGLDS
jgi:hypothetical protein